MSRSLFDLLAQERMISPEICSEYVHSPDGSGDPVRAVIRRNLISENKLVNFLSQKFTLPAVDLTKVPIQQSAVDELSPELAKKFEAVPVQMKGKTIVVAISDPTIAERMMGLREESGREIQYVIAAMTALDAALVKYYGTASLVRSISENFGKVVKSKGEQKPSDLGEIFSIGTKMDLVQQPIISLANSLFEEAIIRGASDIHVEPLEDCIRVRMRVDGTLREIVTLPADLKSPLISRFKVMARLDITDVIHPQDGRIRLLFRDQRTDFRLNTLPTFFGEKVVLRALTQVAKGFDLGKLGFLSDQLEHVRRAIRAPNGLVLVTGPTGSGKTTTLYGALSELNDVADNISTVEDPVEINLRGVVQTQVNRETNLTFGNVLRALLRQDPDVLLVGEIRDSETAEIAVQAALTGHLVLSTLHTNDAPSALLRLVNMKVEPYLIVGALSCVVSQRLVRKICTGCKEAEQIPDSVLQSLGFKLENKSHLHFMRGSGCIQCDYTGYRGRIGVYEVLPITSSIKEAVLRGINVIELRKLAKSEGMKSLRQMAMDRALAGETTLEEAVSVSLQA